MLKKRIFGMVTTSASRQYTPLALSTFYQHTTLTASDTILLIDNDGASDIDVKSCQQMEEIRNSAPLGFAENVNQGIERALETGADLYFLNNDLVFTKGWAEPLQRDENAILSPLSNREVQYASSVIVPKTGHVASTFSTPMEMQLDDYLENSAQVDAIAETHRKKTTGEFEVFVLPYFCVRLPLQVMQTLGRFDTSYGKGGAEDYDYSLRGYLAGISTKFIADSWIVHFYGKSTWSGAEERAQREQRENIFKSRFREKWGEHLFELVFNENVSILEKLGINPTESVAERVRQLVQDRPIQLKL